MTIDLPESFFKILVKLLTSCQPKTVISKTYKPTLTGLKPSNRNVSNEIFRIKKWRIINLRKSVNIQYARGSDRNFHLRRSAWWTVILNRAYYFLAFYYLPKYNVFPIQLKRYVNKKGQRMKDHLTYPLCLSCCDEELGAISVFTSVGHGKKKRFRMFLIEILI